MKVFNLLAVLVATSKCSDEEQALTQLNEPKPKMLFDVFGDPNTLPKAKVIQNRLARPAEYHAMRAVNNCTFPLDIVIVQDATASFGDDYDEMRNTQLKLMVEGIMPSHPNTRFGLVSFKDKPQRTLGEPWDYCHRYDLPLQSATYETLYNAYGDLVSSGGQDPAENQFGAIIAALQSSTVGWNAASLFSTKLIVLSTDAWPHFNDDGLNAYGMTTNTGALDADEDAQCRKQYYPSPVQVQAALNQAGAYSAFLVFDGDWANNLVLRSWEWFNTFLGQSEAFLEPLANDSSNFWEMLAKVIRQIESEECVVATTPVPITVAPTTPVPITVAPTTPAPITVAPTTPAPITVAPTTLAPITVAPTTPAPVTVAPTTPVLTTNIPDVTVTPAGTTEAEVCPPKSDCECAMCPCPEVVIQLRNRPASLNLQVEN